MSFGIVILDRRQASADARRRTIDSVPDFVVGLVVGVAFGLVVVGFIAVGSFDRGWDAALRRTALSKIAH